MNTTETNGNGGRAVKTNAAWARAFAIARAAGTAGSLRRPGRAVGLWAAGVAMFAAFPALAQIAGERVSAGSASFQRLGNTTTITAANNTIINYSQFNVRGNEAVRFVQPDALSRVLNRINSSVPSRIDGSIQSNGRVYIVNPAGVYFGKGAMINVGGIYAAAGNITDANFMRGVNQFTTTPGARVVNEGRIQADVVGLIGSQVFNFGAVDAPSGTVAMVSGDSVLLGERDGHVFAKVETTPEQARAQAVGPMPREGGGGSTQSAVSSRNGKFGAGDIYGLAVWNKGTVKARDIYIEGQKSVVKVEGTLDASNAAGGAHGGSVKVLGEYVGVYDATVDVSGDAGGGTVMLGGNVRGKGSERTSRGTYTSEGSTIKADALNTGTGGTVAVWSDETTRTYGTVSAKGGAAGGDGGFVETSSHGVLDVGTAPSVGAAHGSGGTWLIDPANIVISSGSNSGFTTLTSPFIPDNGVSDSVLNVSTLLTAFAGNAHVIVNTQNTGGTGAGNITVSSAIDFNGTASNALSLIANNNVTINANIFDSNTTNTTDKLAVVLKADSDNAGGGGVFVNSSVATRGGAFLSTGASFANSAGGTIVSSNGVSDGDITIIARAGDIALGGNLAAGSGLLRLQASGGINQTGGTVQGGSVGARSGTGGISLRRSGNNVNTVAFSSSGANQEVNYGSDTDGFDVGAVSADPAINVGGVVDAGGNFTATNGITTNQGAVGLVGGGMQITQPIVATGATVRLVATATNGAISESGSGSIQADSLGGIADGAITLQSASNNVNQVAFNAKGVSFGLDSSGFSIGEVVADAANSFLLTTGITSTGDVLLSGANMDFQASLNAAGQTVRLVATTGQIYQTDGSITATTLGAKTLGLSGQTYISLGGDVQFFAASTANAGQAVEFTDVNGFTVGQVTASGAFGLTTGVSTVNGPILLTSGNGLMTLNQNVSAGTNTVYLNAAAGVDQTGGAISGVAIDLQGAGNFTLNQAANNVVALGANMTAPANVSYTSDNPIVLVASAVNGNITVESNDINLGAAVSSTASTGVLTLQPRADNVSVRVGDAGAGTLVIDATDISRIGNFDGGIVIGRTTGTALTNIGNTVFNDSIAILQGGAGGQINVNQPITNLGHDVLLWSGAALNLGVDINAGSGVVRLRSGAGIAQSGGTITASAVGARAASDISFLTDNLVTTFAAATTGNDKQVTFFSTGLDVNAVSGFGSLFSAVSGVSAFGNSTVFLDGGTGTLNVSKLIDGGTGTVMLRGTRLTQTSTGIVSAGTLGLRSLQLSGGGVVFDQANNASTVAIEADNGQSIIYRDTNGMSVGSVPAFTPGGSQQFDAIPGVRFVTDSSGVSKGAGDIYLTAGAGGLVINQPINATGIQPTGGTIRLTTTGAGNPILQNGGGTIIGASLGLRAGGNITLNEATNNVGVLAADLAPASSQLQYRDADGFDVGSVAALTTLFAQTDGITTNNGDVLLQSGGLLTLANSIGAGSGTVRLYNSAGGIRETGGVVIASALGAITAGSGVINLDGNNHVASFAANAVNDVTLHNVDATALTIGAGGVSALGQFTQTNGITTSDSDILVNAGGDLALANDINAGTIGKVRLASGGTITQSAGKVVGAGLGVRSGGTVNLPSATNDVKEFAASLTGAGAGVTLRTANDLDVTLVGGGGALFPATSGITTVDGSATITAGSLVNINRPITLGAGTAIINSGGTIDQTAPITAAALGVTANGRVILDDANNNVTTFSGSTAANDLFYKDVSGVTLAPVGSATDAISVPDGDVRISANGPIGISGDIKSGAISHGIVTLDTTSATNGGVVQTSGSIVAKSLAVDTVAGPITLNSAGNNVDVFAANAAFGTGNDISYVDADNLTIGAVANPLGVPVAGVNAVGGSVLVKAGRDLFVADDIEAGTSIELRAADTTGLGKLSFNNAFRVLRAPTITLASGNGAGAGTGSTVDFTNAPLLQGATSIVSPTSFSIIDDGDIGDAQLPLASRFASGIAGVNYTLQSREGSITIDSGSAGKVTNTNLTLTAATQTNLLTDLTLRGLTLNGTANMAGITADTNPISLNGAVTLNQPNVTWTANEIDLSSNTTITGQALTLRPFAVGGDVAIGGTTSTGALDITQDELAALRNSTLTALTIGRADGTGTTNINAESRFNSALTLVTGGTGGKTVLSGNVLNAGKSITLSSPVELGADAEVRSTDNSNPGGAAITFASAVNTKSGDAAHKLTVDGGTGGVVTFGQALGQTAALLELNATGQTINLRSVKTTGKQTYTGAVALAASTSLETDKAATHDVTFNGTLNGAQDLAVDVGAADITFGGTVGGTTPLTSVTTTTTGTGSTTVGSIATTGNQIFNGATRVGAASSVLNSTSGVITFAGALDNDVTGGPFGLTVTTNGSTGLVTFGGDVGNSYANAPLADLSVTGAAVTLRNVTTTGNQSYTGSTTLAGNTTSLASTAAGGGGNITFNNALNGVSDLTLSAGTGTVTFGAAVGGNSPLTKLSVAAGNTIVRDVTTTGSQVYTGPVTLGNSSTIKTGKGLNQDVTFNSTVDGAQALNVETGLGKITFGAAVGGTTPLTSLDVAGATTIHSITTTGTQNFTGATSVAGANTVVTSSAGNVNFGSSVDSAAGAGQAGLTVLTNTTNGNVVFSGEIGNSSSASPLSQLQVTGNTITLRSATTTGQQSYSGATTLAGDTVSLNSAAADGGGDITFNNTIDGASILAMNAGTGTVRLKGSVGTTTAPKRLEISSATVLGDSAGGAVTLRSSQAMAAGVDGMRFRGAVRLANNTTLDLQQGSVFFGSSVNSDTATQRSLTLVTGALPTQVVSGSKPVVLTPVKFAGNIGDVNALSELMITGPSDGALASAATVVMAGSDPGTSDGRNSAAYFDANGNLVIGVGFVGDAVNRKITVGSFKMDKGTALTAVGGLTITSTGVAELSDLNALGDLTVNASSLVFKTRTSKPSVFINRTLPKSTDLATTRDDALTFVSGRNLAFTSTGGSVTGTARAVLSKDFGSVSLNGATVNNGGAIELIRSKGNFTRDNLVVNGSPGSTAGLGLDFSDNTETNPGLASVLASALPGDPGSGTARTTVSLPGSLRDQLEKIGIFTKSGDYTEAVADLLGGRAIYNDIPRVSSPNGAQGDYAISAQRLSRPAVERVLAAYDDLAGSDVSTRQERYRDLADKIGESWSRYRATLPASGAPDALAFRRFVEVTPNEAETLQILDHVRTVLQRLDDMGLTVVEARFPKNLLLGDIKPDPQYDMSDVQLEEAAMGVHVAAPK